MKLAFNLEIARQQQMRFSKCSEQLGKIISTKFEGVLSIVITSIWRISYIKCPGATYRGLTYRKGPLRARMGTGLSKFTVSQ